MMKYVLFILIISGVIFSILILSDNNAPDKNLESGQEEVSEAILKEITPENNTMEIKSAAFNHNQSIPEKYTCDGDDHNPSLQFFGIPEDAQSLVLIMDDPDASVGLWIHWTIWNIDPRETGIPENSILSGITEGVTSFGKSGYGGPCPSDGEHRYFFKLYALDTKLDLDSDARKEDIEKAMEGHILLQAELIGLYNRNK